MQLLQLLLSYWPLFYRRNLVSGALENRAKVQLFNVSLKNKLVTNSNLPFCFLQNLVQAQIYSIGVMSNKNSRGVFFFFWEEVMPFRMRLRSLDYLFGLEVIFPR